jgi:hypothetical protein
MKKKKELKPVPVSAKRTCQTCEFDSEEMCTIHGEGYKSRETFNTCNDWSISLTAFTKQDKRSKR